MQFKLTTSKALTQELADQLLEAFGKQGLEFGGTFNADFSPEATTKGYTAEGELTHEEGKDVKAALEKALKPLDFVKTHTLGE